MRFEMGVDFVMIDEEFDQRRLKLNLSSRSLCNRLLTSNTIRNTMHVALLTVCPSGNTAKHRLPYRPATYTFHIGFSELSANKIMA